jgi:hypothetical protein
MFRFCCLFAITITFFLLVYPILMKRMCKGLSEFESLIRRYPDRLLDISSGHVHRPVSGAFASIPANICGSVCPACPFMVWISKRYARTGKANSDYSPVRAEKTQQRSCLYLTIIIYPLNGICGLNLRFWRRPVRVKRKIRFERNAT